MFSDIHIRVDQLSKCYLIYDAPRDRLKQFVVPRFKRLFGWQANNYFREFWALRDITFEVKRGETLGIIGRNGSGKSTLLQLICGTLSPSSGQIQSNGRIAALLELGSGFNPEFTGRENVYLNGSLLGLTREEINDRFEDIAAFADIGEFIDQPVKTYSSGMYVRLAFAVIAHVDADILIIDEALSVGDAIFTQKCMRYIRSFQQRGTLLFVSHDIGAVLNLCQTAIWLDHGQIRLMGESKTVGENYLKYTLQETYGEETMLSSVNEPGGEEVTAEITSRSLSQDRSIVNYETELFVENNLNAARGWRSGHAEIKGVYLEDIHTKKNNVFLGGENVRLSIRAVAHRRINKPILGFLVRDRLGQDLFGENTLLFTKHHPLSIDGGQEFIGEFYFRLPMLPNGKYAVMTSVAEGELQDHIQHHWLHDALIFDVCSSKVRWGLVGIEFSKVQMRVLHEEFS